MRILITGGAGFVGSSLAKLFRDHGRGHEVVVFDNLRRRGSEMNLASFRREGIDFVHGDIRSEDDLDQLEGTFDVLIEASAEPSVHAGVGQGSARYLLDTNLGGTLNCLEFARERCGFTVFLSTSRVYSIPMLRSIRLQAGGTRFEPDGAGQPPGFSDEGVSEEFPVVAAGFRSLYGTTKLASELFVEEYCANFGLHAVVNRCGVIAGPGQFGKTDQGVFTLWVARHLYGGTLQYFGWGGKGLQVRDLLHPEDLYRLICAEIDQASELRGRVYGIGGGVKGSASLFEYTQVCEKITGQVIQIGSRPETAEVDVPYFVTDSRKASEKFSWCPKKSVEDIVADIHAWLVSGGENLRALFV